MRVPLFTLLGSFCLRVCKGGKQPTGAASRKKDILRIQQAAWNFFRQPKTVSFVVKVSLVVMLGLFFLGTLGASVKGAHGLGHVAVVERVYSDGSVLASNTSWGSNPYQVTYVHFYPGSGVTFIQW